MIFSLKGKRVWVAGHKGMVGSAILRRLQQENCTILTVPRSEVDLERQDDVQKWVALHKPDVVFLAAARVGGIHANMTYPVDFLLRNLQIETNVMDAAHRAGVEKFIFLGSSCIYPRNAAQPMTEEMLLTGLLEPTNEFYAIAKIAGIKLCAAYQRQYGASFISLMPTNLYGPGDNFDFENGHVPAALMMRFHAAKQQGDKTVAVWGTGTPLREFLYVDDLADAAVFLAQHYDDALPINVGSGHENLS